MNERLSTELEDLHAYVDDQLAPDARQRIEAWLDEDPQERRRADDYMAIRDGLRALYAPVMDEPIPAGLTVKSRSRTWRRPLMAMAASLALLVVGALVGMQLERGTLKSVVETAHVVREAAMAYAVYVPEVLHPVEVGGDQEEQLVSWLSRRMGVAFQAPKLADLGFSLIGGRLLSSDDGPGALLMYEDAEGKRIILYACLNDEEGRDTAFRFAQDEGISVFYWLQGPLSYALAGELDRGVLRDLTEAVYSQVTG